MRDREIRVLRKSFNPLTPGPNHFPLQRKEPEKRKGRIAKEEDMRWIEN